jgi:hypothetical protein
MQQHQLHSQTIIPSTTITAPAHWRHSDIELIGDPEKDQDFLERTITS